MSATTRVKGKDKAESSPDSAAAEAPPIPPAENLSIENIDNLMDSFAEELAELNLTSDVGAESGAGAGQAGADQTSVTSISEFLPPGFTQPGPQESWFIRVLYRCIRFYFINYCDVFFRPVYWRKQMGLFIKVWVVQWYGRKKKWQHFTVGYLSWANLRQYGQQIKGNLKQRKTDFQNNILPLWIDKFKAWLEKKVEYLKKNYNKESIQQKIGQFQIALAENRAKFGFLSLRQKIMVVGVTVLPAIIVFGCTSYLIYYLFFSPHRLKQAIEFSGRSLATVRGEREPPVKELLIEFRGLLVNLQPYTWTKKNWDEEVEGPEPARGPEKLDEPADIIKKIKQTPLIRLSIDVVVEVPTKYCRSEVNDRYMELKAGMVRIIENRNPNQLESIEGKIELKKDLINFFNQQIKKGPILDIYILSFMMHK